MKNRTIPNQSSIDFDRADLVGPINVLEDFPYFLDSPTVQFAGSNVGRLLLFGISPRQSRGQLGSK